MQRWRSHLVLIAAVLGLFSIGTRQTAAALHWHAPEHLGHIEHDERGDEGGHEDHEHDCPHEEESEGGCVICEAIAGGADLPRVPDRVPLPVEAGFAELLGDERAAVLLAVREVLARGPPALI